MVVDADAEVTDLMCAYFTLRKQAEDVRRRLDQARRDAGLDVRDFTNVETAGRASDDVQLYAQLKIQQASVLSRVESLVTHARSV